MSTGVDWKSISIPACLPITTDFFPEHKTLQDDYVLNDYNLVPDEINADYVQSSRMPKAPLSTR